MQSPNPISNTPPEPAAFDEGAEARKLFAELGITETVLHRAVRTAEEVRRFIIQSARLAPPFVPGIAGWGVMLGIIAEVEGWELRSLNQMQSVVHAGRRIAIAVANGDAATGTEAEPSTQYRKGYAHQIAIGVNRSLGEQLSFVDLLKPLDTQDAPPPTGEGEDPKVVAEDDDDTMTYATWYLLVHRDRSEARVELSIPTVINEGVVSKWRPRIQFSSIQLDVASTGPQTTEPLDAAERPIVVVEPIEP